MRHLPLRLRTTVLLLSVAAVLAAAPTAFAPAQEGGVDESRDPTVRYQDMGGIVERIADQVEKDDPAASVIVWAVDVDTLWHQGVGDKLAAEVERVFGERPENARPRMAVASFTGDTVEVVGRATTDPAATAEALRTLPEPDGDAIRDLMSGLRKVAGGLPSASDGGRSHVVVFSLENVDGESRVEKTAGLLHVKGITLHVIGRGAYVSDSYWAVRQGSGGFGGRLDLPKGMRLAGPESPYREMAVGWIFDRVGLDNVPPAGFGVWAWSRMAHVTGGRYYQWYAGSDDGITFCRYHACPFCDGEHQACVPPYNQTYLRLLAPELGSRAAASNHYSSSDLWEAVEEGWDEAADAGVVMTMPPRLTGSRTPDPDDAGGYNPKFSQLLSGNSLKSRARNAVRAADDLDDAIRDVERALERAKRDPEIRRKEPRALAVLETLEAQMKAARFNLRQLAWFVQELEQERRGRAGLGPLDRPLGPGDPPDQPHVEGLTWRNLFFCHGAEPIRRVRWLGDERMQEELQDLCDTVQRNIDTHGSTPYELANRRIALAVFDAVWFIQGTGSGSSRRRDKDEGEEERTETERRSRRGGGGGGGGGGGPSTGGGK